MSCNLFKHSVDYFLLAVYVWCNTWILKLCINHKFLLHRTFITHLCITQVCRPSKVDTAEWATVWLWSCSCWWCGTAIYISPGDLWYYMNLLPSYTIYFLHFSRKINIIILHCLEFYSTWLSGSVKFLFLFYFQVTCNFKFESWVYLKILVFGIVGD